MKIYESLNFRFFFFTKKEERKEIEIYIFQDFCFFFYTWAEIFVHIYVSALEFSNNSCLGMCVGTFL